VLDKDRRLFATLTVSEAHEAIASGTVQGGMIPKLECCMRAASRGVRYAHIIDGRVPHAILLEIFTDGGVGTRVGAS
jgi:acetylglutamate kinase